MNFAKHLFLVLIVCGSVLLSRGAQAQAYACVETNLGEFCMQLLTGDAPNTVANFLKYVTDGDYNNTLIHRSVPNFAIQGGGYKLDPLGEEVPADPAIPNEFLNSNVRGTVAMAKFAGDPNSASTEWFVNLTDNSGTLNVSNGGYTVFARIVKGMSVVDMISAAGRVDLTATLGAAFGEVPVLAKDEDGVGVEDLVQVLRVYTTEIVVPDTDSPSEQENAAQRLYQCTADWVAAVAPSNACLDTSLGAICMTLHPDTAPNTVANFLHYVADGDYNATFFHRSVPGFVVQGGGYRLTPLWAGVATDPPVANEFSRSNLRGTVAMAKSPGAPDSATSQWFVNLADNSALLNADNGGYTVFATVDEAGLAVMDQIAALGRLNIDSMAPGLTEVPLLKYDGSGLSTGDLVRISSAYIPDAGPNPCFPPKPATTTEYANQAFNLPVRIDGQLYHMFFVRDFANSGFVFNVDLQRIRTLVDLGQDAAVYTRADGIMVIPSVLNGQTVLTNVRLRVANPSILQFVLESYTAP